MYCQDLMDRTGYGLYGVMGYQKDKKPIRGVGEHSRFGMIMMISVASDARSVENAGGAAL